MPSAQALDERVQVGLSRYVSSSGRNWIRKGGFAVIDQGLISGSGLLVNILLARWLSPPQYGAYALAFSILLFVSGFHNALLLEPMGVFGPSVYASVIRRYLGRLLWLHFIITLGLIAVLGPCIPITSRWFNIDIAVPALYGATLALPWILWFWLWRQAAYLDLRSALAARGAVVYFASTVSLLVTLYYLRRLSAGTAFLVQALSGVAASVSIIAVIRPSPVFSVSLPIGSVIAQHWRYGRWAVLTSFVYGVSAYGYYFIAGAALHIHDVGALKALQNLVLPVSQINSAMSLLMLPWASRELASFRSAGFNKAIRKINLLFLSVGLGYTACICLFANWLMSFLYGGRYTEHTSLIPIFALSVVVNAASQGSVIALRAMRRPSGVFWGYTASALLTITLVPFLCRHLALLGVALGSLGAAVVFFIVIKWHCRTQLNILNK